MPMERSGFIFTHGEENSHSLNQNVIFSIECTPTHRLLHAAINQGCHGAHGGKQDFSQCMACRRLSIQEIEDSLEKRLRI